MVNQRSVLRELWEVLEAHGIVDEVSAATEGETTMQGRAWAALHDASESRIATCCPTCGAQALVIGAGGHLTCAADGCGQPNLSLWAKDVLASLEAIRRWERGASIQAASSGIDERPTYGFGHLDDCGFFEYPLSEAFVERVRAIRLEARARADAASRGAAWKYLLEWADRIVEHPGALGTSDIESFAQSVVVYLSQEPAAVTPPARSFKC